MVRASGAMVGTSDWAAIASFRFRFAWGCREVLAKGSCGVPCLALTYKRNALRGHCISVLRAYTLRMNSANVAVLL